VNPHERLRHGPLTRVISDAISELLIGSVINANLIDAIFDDQPAPDPSN
jgi:hypothetical protein